MQEKYHGFISRMLCNLSLFIYLIWILLPTMQEALHSWPGLIAIALLGAGMIVDRKWFSTHWWKILLCAVCLLLLAYAGALLLRHGVTNTQSFLVSRCMFFYPFLLAAYFLTNPDAMLWKGMHTVIIACVTVTALITLFWNVEGFINRMENGSVHAYSRMIYDRRIDLETISSYNLRGIGSLPFIYAEVFLLPFICIWLGESRGAKRIGYALFLVLNTLCIVTAQFTFAMVFAAIILWVELLGLIIRKLSKGKIGMSLSMLLGFIPLLLMLIFLPAITDFAFTFAKRHKLSFIRSALKDLYQLTKGGWGGIVHSLSQQFAEICETPVPTYLEGGEWYDPGRITLYMMSLSGFVTSPWIGSMGGSPILTGYHSDLLDALSACGILGTALISAMFVFLLRPCLAAMRKSSHRAHFGLIGFIAFLLTLLTTYLCCREISAIFVTALLPLCIQTVPYKRLLSKSGPDE